MKRTTVLLCAVCLLAACLSAYPFRSMAEGARVAISATQSDEAYQLKYDDMIAAFNDGEYEEALEYADEVFSADSSYKDILKYDLYLRALIEDIPDKEYKKAYETFALLSGSGFEKSEAYAAYALGHIQWQEGTLGGGTYDYGKLREARENLQIAGNKGINEALLDVLALNNIIPADDENTSEQSILMQVDADATSMTVTWKDKPAAGPFLVIWSLEGIPTPVGRMETEQFQATLTGLLPDSAYLVKVTETKSSSYYESGVFYTQPALQVSDNQAHRIKISPYLLDRASVTRLGVDKVVNTQKDKCIRIAEDGYTPGNRKPSESRNDLYAYISFAADKLKEETTVQFTYILRSDTNPVISVGKTDEVTLRKDKLNQSFYTSCLTELLDQLYENGGLAGETLVMEVYMNDLYMSTQDIILNPN